MDRGKRSRKTLQGFPSFPVLKHSPGARTFVLLFEMPRPLPHDPCRSRQTRPTEVARLLLESELSDASHNM